MTVTAEAPAPEGPALTSPEPVQDGPGAAQAAANTPVTTRALELHTLDQKIAYAQTLSNANLLPPAYRGKEANVLYAIELGGMLGLHPVAAINSIHIIEGKPSMAAVLMATQARKAGHRVRVWSTKDEAGFPVGHCEIRRCDDPDFPFKTEFTVQDAVDAGLCEIRHGKTYQRSEKGKPGNWEKYPRPMVKHRALSEAVRDACPEALLGVMYTPEEMGAEVDKEGNLVAYPPGSAEAAREGRAAAYAEQRDDDVQDAVIVEDLTVDEQRACIIAEIGAIARILGISWDDAARPVASNVVDLPETPSRAQVRAAIRDAEPEAVVRVLGPMRGAVAAKLQIGGDHDAADAYLRVGQTLIGRLSTLFGRDDADEVFGYQGPDPFGDDAPPSEQETAQGPVDGEGQGEGGEGQGEDGGDGELVEPHLFESREDDADGCANCPLPAHHPIHDPRRGM